MLEIGAVLFYYKLGQMLLEIRPVLSVEIVAKVLVQIGTVATS